MIHRTEREGFQPPKRKKERKKKENFRKEREKSIRRDKAMMDWRSIGVS